MKWITLHDKGVVVAVNAATVEDARDASGSLSLRFISGERRYYDESLKQYREKVEGHA